jgi:hypothetical protein
MGLRRLQGLRQGYIIDIENGRCVENIDGADTVELQHAKVRLRYNIGSFGWSLEGHRKKVKKVSLM